MQDREAASASGEKKTVKGSAMWNYRDRHRWLAALAFVPVFVTVCSGMTYRISREWFDADKHQVGWFMDVHDMTVLSLQEYYPLFVGWLVLSMAASGLGIAGLRGLVPCAVLDMPLKGTPRAIHRIATTLCVLPMVITSATGFIFTLGKYYFSFEESTLKTLMWIHQGKWTGSAAGYVFLNGTGFLVVLLSGVAMSDLTKQFTNRGR
eukprot:gb/GEZN01014553.1/.p1 GENE.gb/GEZN01014553.1/~~gb/GEZN01014553.1/.p1  ORF type:complete len:207 (+),score=17.41 gb/GEZN01014553.1/:28-648(+)